MNEKTMRESLLQQNPSPSAALKMLYDLMDGEERRVRRLTRWAWVVWGIWLAFLVVYASLLLAVFLQPTPDAVLRRPVVWPVWLVLVPLAVIGAILLIARSMATHRATISQLRVSVAAIDEQLQALAAARPPQPGERKD
jgi:hypothetical protein